MITLSSFSMCSAAAPATLAPAPLAVSFTSGQIIALSAIIGGIALIIITIYLGLRYAQQRQQLWHETARLALEKGQPIPLPPPESEADRAADAHNDLKSALILIALGAGLALMLKDHGIVGLAGAIPFFIGLALLISWLLQRRSGRHAERPGESGEHTRS